MKKNRMHTTSRRRFLQLAGASTVVLADTVLAQDPFESLINNQYANRVRFLRQAGGQYFGADFRLAPTPTEWLLKLGRYPGRYQGTAVDLHGYWIFRTDANQCWQAVNRGGGPLKYWNADGRAAGNPEDWELFSFSAVDRSERTVKIFNTSWATYRRAVGSLPDRRRDWRNHIGLTGETFSCNESEQNAAIFVVEFV
jgi:hypothetical protein